LTLQAREGLAIVPAHLTTTLDPEQPLDVIPVMSWWARGTVLAMATIMTAVFGVAIWLNPYDEEGRPRLSETHRQLGLPPCTFKDMVGVPCPSCGMTSSFAHLVRGDLKNSLRANAVGTLLALTGALAIPWLALCGLTGRPYLMATLERGMLGIAVMFLTFLFLRWAIVLLLLWLNRT
jgi:Protein of unknown function (DUF2752)